MRINLYVIKKAVSFESVGTILIRIRVNRRARCAAFIVNFSTTAVFYVYARKSRALFKMDDICQNVVF